MGHAGRTHCRCMSWPTAPVSRGTPPHCCVPPSGLNATPADGAAAPRPVVFLQHALLDSRWGSLAAGGVGAGDRGLGWGWARAGFGLLWDVGRAKAPPPLRRPAPPRSADQYEASPSPHWHCSTGRPPFCPTSCLSACLPAPCNTSPCAVMPTQRRLCGHGPGPQPGLHPRRRRLVAGWVGGRVRAATEQPTTTTTGRFRPLLRVSPAALRGCCCC